MVLEGAGIIFPNLGIEIGDFSKTFTVFGVTIAWYGVIIAVGMIFAVVLSMILAKRTKQDTDDYIDIAIWCIIGALIGARAYYVIFSWEDYKDNLLQIFNIRAGGLAIYGGLIAGVIVAAIVCRVKKISFFRVLDTCAPGIVFAQAIGRWGNFVNREAYGGYTDSLFAMQIKYEDAGGTITQELIDNMVTIDGVEYIQVHPTFLYESMWCLVVGILILIFRKKQRYNGEVILWYIFGYALGRSWIEGLRTDQLLIGNSSIAVSQLLSVALAAGSLAILIINRIRLATKSWQPAFEFVLSPGEPGTVEYTQAKTEARKAKRKAKKEAREGSAGEEGASEAAAPEAETGEGTAEETSEGETSAQGEISEGEESSAEAVSEAENPEEGNMREEAEAGEETSADGSSNQDASEEKLPRKDEDSGLEDISDDMFEMADLSDAELEEAESENIPESFKAEGASQDGEK